MPPKPPPEPPPLAIRPPPQRVDIPPPPGRLSPEDLAFVQDAVRYLESPGFLLRAANVVGKPAEALLQRLPDRAHKAVAKAVHKAMQAALQAAVATLDRETAPVAHDSVTAARAATFKDGMLHSAATAATGFAGGFFGLAGLPVELPVTTALMLRSIAGVAREFGFDPDDPAVRLECLTVLALGGSMTTPADARLGGGLDGSADAGDISAMESSYYTARLGLALALRSATGYLVGRTAAEIAEAVTKGTAPALVRLVGLIAARFNVVVSEKAIAQALPLVGATAGAALNAAFTDHFNHVARLHFGLKRLESQHGERAVQQAYGAALALDNQAKSLR